MSMSGRLLAATVLAILTLATIQPADAHLVLLRWEHPDPTQIEGFNIYKSTQPGDSSSTPVLTLTKSNVTVDASGNYSELVEFSDTAAEYVRITAYNATGAESVYSNEGAVPVPGGTLPPEIDSDGDSVSDAVDAFPNNPSEWIDSDGDGVGNNADAYPNDPTRSELDPPIETTYRINAGGGNYTDGDGIFWAADTGYYTTGDATASAGTIAGTNADDMYSSARWDRPEGSVMTYRFPLSPGSYLIRLHFAETYVTSPGERRFHVDVEQNRIFENLDIFDEAGHRTALVKEVNIQVNDGTLEITFLHGDAAHPNPIISGIEITPSTTPPLPPGRPTIIQ